MNTNEVNYDGFFYTINPEDKTAVLSRTNSSNPQFRQDQVLLDLEIPSFMYYNDEKYTVTGIADSAFRECHAFESVDIPTSVVFILRSAFLHCKSLKKVIIRGEVEIPLFKGVFTGTNLSEIHWYGVIDELNYFLQRMVSDESLYHPDYDVITIHVRKDSDIHILEYMMPYINEKGLSVKFKIEKDL